MDLLATMERIKKNQANMPENIPSIEIRYSCELCQDKEIVLEQNYGDWVAKECSCKTKKRMQRIIKASGLTDVLREKTFSSYQKKPSVENMYSTCFDYVKNYPNIKNQRSNGIALTGTVGVGKTHLLAAVANNLLTKGIEVCFINTPELIQELRAAQFTNAVQMDKQIELIKNCEVVIFDDLAKEKCTEWVQTQYYIIINHRYINNRPTLFSTNCSFEELEDKLGPATASRLFSMTKDRLIHVEADDYRMEER